MTLTMPIRPTKPPSYITSSMNGTVDDSFLLTVEPSKTAKVWKMVGICARSMRALHAEALAAGIVLTSTGRGRTYQEQYNLFLSRHNPVSKAVYDATPSNGNGNKRFWPEGVTKHGLPSAYWLLKPGMAAAAIPGTSPHGLWVADDTAEIVNGTVIGLRATTVQWLYGHALKYGFGWSIPSETWHLQWYVGDEIPAATLAYEDSLHPGPTGPSGPTGPLPSPGDDDMSITIFQCVDAAASFIAYTVPAPVGGQPIALAVSWIQTVERLEAFKSLGVKTANVGAADLKTCDLLGPVPHGDYYPWTKANFASVSIQA